MRMKKLLTSVCAVVMIVALGACGGGQTPAENPGEKEAVVTEQPDGKEPEKTEEGKDVEQEKVPSEDKAVEEKEPEVENPVTSEESIGDDIEALEAFVEKDVEDTIAALEKEYEKLVEAIDSYEKYKLNIDKVEAFYTKTYNENKALCLRLYEYSYDYADLVMNSELTCDDKYEELKEVYDVIYDDAGGEIFDEIYSGVLADIYDEFYSGILSDAYETVPYSEWADMRSTEYDWWSDTRSDVYDDWADCRSDIYDFWSDIRGELWDEDIQKAEKLMNEFREDIDKLKKKAGDKEESSVSKTVQKPSPTAEPEVDDNAEESIQEASIRPEFKEALDSYEEFFDEYCSFMKKYKENPTDLGLLTEYADFLTKYTEAMKKLSALNDGSLNEEELKYYLQVTNRINEKRLEVAL